MAVALLQAILLPSPARAWTPCRQCGPEVQSVPAASTARGGATILLTLATSLQAAPSAAQPGHDMVRQSVPKRTAEQQRPAWWPWSLVRQPAPQQQSPQSFSKS